MEAEMYKTWEEHGVCTHWSVFLLWWASQVAQWWRIHLPMQETQEMQLWSLGQEDPPEKEMATHSRILAWRIPWTEKPGGLQYKGLQRVGYDWATEHNFCEVIQGAWPGSPVGLHHFKSPCTTVFSDPWDAEMLGGGFTKTHSLKIWGWGQIWSPV